MVLRPVAARRVRLLLGALSLGNLQNAYARQGEASAGATWPGGARCGEPGGGLGAASGAARLG